MRCSRESLVNDEVCVVRPHVAAITPTHEATISQRCVELGRGVPAACTENRQAAIGCRHAGDADEQIEHRLGGQARHRGAADVLRSLDPLAEEGANIHDRAARTRGPALIVRNQNDLVAQARE